MSNKQSIQFVVLGIDNTNNPRAAKFPESEAVTAGKAAEVMGLRLRKGDNEKAQAALKNRPRLRHNRAAMMFMRVVADLECADLHFVSPTSAAPLPEAPLCTPSPA